MNARIVRRVVAGGLWLSMVKPGWQALIDWNVLDVSNSTLCVAGQVFASDAKAEQESTGECWWSGYDMLRTRYGLAPWDRAGLGFTTDDVDDQGDADPWQAIQDAWRTLWGPQDRPGHVDYPHQPGTLYDCPVCESLCLCGADELEGNPCLSVGCRNA